MHKHLIKIEKIVKGTAQLFTAMDKGFAKVESDLTLLSRFRIICYEATQSLENTIPVLQKHIKYTSAWENDAQSSETFNKTVYNDLLIIRNTLSNNIISISDYIDDFADLWKKSFSLNALLKFKLLLINEFSLLEREIESLEMEILLRKRTQQINLHQSELNITEGTGLSK